MISQERRCYGWRAQTSMAPLSTHPATHGTGDDDVLQQTHTEATWNLSSQELPNLQDEVMQAPSALA